MSLDQPVPVKKMKKKTSVQAPVPAPFERSPIQAPAPAPLGLYNTAAISPWEPVRQGLKLSLHGARLALGCFIISTVAQCVAIYGVTSAQFEITRLGGLILILGGFAGLAGGIAWLIGVSFCTFCPKGSLPRHMAFATVWTLFGGIGVMFVGALFTTVSFVLGIALLVLGGLSFVASQLVWIIFFIALGKGFGEPKIVRHAQYLLIVAIVLPFVNYALQSYMYDVVQRDPQAAMATVLAAVAVSFVISIGFILAYILLNRSMLDIVVSSGIKGKGVAFAKPHSKTDDLLDDDLLPDDLLPDELPHEEVPMPPRRRVDSATDGVVVVKKKKKKKRPLPPPEQALA